MQAVLWLEWEIHRLVADKLIPKVNVWLLPFGLDT